MARVPTLFLQNVTRMANWSHRRSLPGLACIAFVAVIFFPNGETHSRFMLFFLLLPLAGLALFSPGRRVLTNSSVLWACGLYLVAMGFASLVAAGCGGP